MYLIERNNNIIKDININFEHVCIFLYLALSNLKIQKSVIISR